MTDPIASLILTRPRAASDAFIAQLDPELVRHLDVIVSPLLEIVATGDNPDLTDVRGVIFTSANGVDAVGTGHDLPAYCVGKATTARAVASGWRAQNCGANADELVSTLREQAPKGPLLHIAGVHKRGNIAGRLTRLGCETREIDVYDQRLCPLTSQALGALERETPVIVPLFSPRTARQFNDQIKGCHALHVICLSDAVMAEVAGLPTMTRQVAARPCLQAMSESLTNLLRWVEAGGAPQ